MSRRKAERTLAYLGAGERDNHDQVENAALPVQRAPVLQAVFCRIDAILRRSVGKDERRALLPLRV